MSVPRGELQSRASSMAPVDSSTLHMLVYSYLLHTNCGRTAKAFARTSGLATSGRLQSSDAPPYLSTVAGAGGEDTGADAAQPPTAKGKEKPLHGAARPGAKTPSVVRAARVSHDGFADPAALDARGAERAGELIDHHIEYLRIRTSICSSIEAGEPAVATDLLSTYFRAVLIPPPSSETPAVSSLPFRREFEATLLRFRLDTQHYVELIANHQELDALQFGQRTLWRYPEIFEAWLEHSLGFSAPTSRRDSAASPREPPKAGAAANGTASAADAIVPREELKMKRAEIMQHITDVAALVAYPDPRKSSLAHLLSPTRRSELAAAVNDAILASMRFPREPALVSLVRQLATTSAYLVGYRSSARSPPSPADDRPRPRTPWVLDTFVNSESVADTFA
ncbi:hypothetical protein H4R19_000821 [Coemansia spiralis]|nr:hypothetical protein H4R19_000821 [Coemansia spiralis]